MTKYRPELRLSGKTNAAFLELKNKLKKTEHDRDEFESLLTEVRNNANTDLKTYCQDCTKTHQGEMLVDWCEICKHDDDDPCGSGICLNCKKARPTHFELKEGIK